jgi:thiamine kinase-like enzyme
MHSSDIKSDGKSNRLLKEVYNQFESDGVFRRAYSTGSGHIHDTFLVETEDKSTDDYILQRLNNHVFKNIPQVQENIERVTSHLRKKLLERPGSDIKRECLTLVPSIEGKTWIMDNQGFYWRMYIYIKDHRSYDTVDTPDKAKEGGKAIGRFQAMLADLGGEPLHETIPWFHDVEKRLGAFYKKMAEDRVDRVKDVVKEIDIVKTRAEKMQIILQLGKEGKIPLRITHNDTKFNNILFDKNDKALCLIDLDTVMPGYVHYDFGDAMRTAANMAAEDEPDLSKIKMNINIFRAYADGYIAEVKDTLNDIEKEWLAFAPLLLTFIMGLRFLTDYIDGDNYYKIDHEHHNIQRARAQFRLLKSMEEQYHEMQRIIMNLI